MPIRVTLIWRAYVKNYSYSWINQITIIIEGEVLSSDINKITVELEPFYTLISGLLFLFSAFKKIICSSPKVCFYRSDGNPTF